MSRPTNGSNPALWIAGLALPFLALPRAGFAADDPKAQARQLFERGAKAVQEGSASEGVALLEQAEALFHAPTHWLYLARGRARLGQLVAAREVYQKLAAEPLSPTASKGFRDAKARGIEELAGLEERLPKIVVSVQPTGAEGLQIERDGASFDLSELGRPVAVDPLPTSLSARASGLEAGKVTVNPAERTTTEVRLLLHPIGQADAPPSLVSVVDTGWSPIRVAGVSLLAVGGGVLAAGGVFGALHFSTSAGADDRYSECNTCESEVTTLDRRAALFGNLGIGLLAGGAALFGGGIVLYASGGSPRVAEGESGSAARLELTLGGPGIALSGTY